MQQLITQLQTAALAAVNPAIAIANFVSRADRILTIADRQYALDDWQIRCLAVGKAAVPMAQQLDRLLGAEVAAGLVVTKHAHLGNVELSPQWQTMAAGHPIPDELSLLAGERVWNFVDNCTDRTLIIAAISGGASALVVAPRSLLALQQLVSTEPAVANLLSHLHQSIESEPSALPIPLSLVQAINRALLGSGWEIGAINALRSQVDRLKGGGLVDRAIPARVVGLILSDVIGDSIGTIASGLTDRPRAENTIVGSNTQACAAVATTAASLGYQPQIVTTALAGEAQQRGREIAREIGSQPPKTILIYGGETTVTLPTDCTGKGGRNQELALAAAIALHERAIPAWVVTLATDGTDGPTDAAGAVVNERTIARASALGLDAKLALDRHDSYPLFDRLGDLTRIGATGTNVADITLAIRP